MKRMIGVVVISLMLMSGIAVSAGNALTEHCKEARNNVCGQETAAMSHQDHSGHGAMHHGNSASSEKLDWAGMSKHMTAMMKTMTGMNQRLADMMATEAAGKKMSELGGLMDEMSSHMLRMADVMNDGGASEADMHSIHMSIDETAKKVEKVR